MQKFVVDSSVVVKWLNQQDEELTTQADKILKDAQNEDIILLTSELAKYEVGNALVIHKEISPAEAEITFKDLFTLPVQFISQNEDLANETYKIAKQAKITYYDACFLALAKHNNATLVTDNIKHQGKDSSIKVVALKDY